ncbi:BTB/POZ and MATH domain-containing protein 2 [Rhynchospora pubera]|uniref:BTB/POZ and MATH domain-containing protein 2 n=1 Tax=Rhynchospora pubera TaxID=906938 RepID=A0AAV8DFE3_9POAL|nr:BTB/POZ and MATH domain-containing protein 2 [Rhynchospora pubera]
MTKLSSVVNTREPETTSTWFTDTRTGSHLFKITGYSFNKGIGLGKCITSDNFTVGGYNWTIECYPDGKLKYIDDSLAFHVKLKSSDEARVKITLNMLSQTGGAPFVRDSGAVTLRPDDYDFCIFPGFIKRTEFEASEYLKNDSFTILCSVTVFKQSSLIENNCETQSFTVQPSNLHQHLTSLLQRGDGKDVSFNVSGVTFEAHRCVLAARSPVFRTELLGPIKVERNQILEIKDMEPSIFKTMLQFIYTDSLPELEEAKGNKDGSIALAQRLLVAADRYGLERLKRICEVTMFKFIDTDNVATTMTLAEQHNCSELKAACLEFIKRPEVLATVLQTERFEHIIKSCPTILEDLRSKSR